MLDWLKIKLKTMFGGKKDDFKRDSRGHAISNHYDTDDFPNEPQDFEGPPIRRPVDRQKQARLLKDLE